MCSAMTIAPVSRCAADRGDDLDAALRERLARQEAGLQRQFQAGDCVLGPRIKRMISSVLERVVARPRPVPFDPRVRSGPGQEAAVAASRRV